MMTESFELGCMDDGGKAPAMNEDRKKQFGMAPGRNMRHGAMDQHTSVSVVSRVRFAGLRPPLTPPTPKHRRINLRDNA
jgi:hypothetical protein